MNDDAVVLRDPREHLGLDEVGVDAGHGVVLQPALAALGVAAAGVDHDGDHRRHALLVDQVVEDRRQIAAVVSPTAVLRDDERRRRAGDVLRRDVDGDLPLVRDDAGLAAGDAGVDLAVLRVHRELVDHAPRHAVLDRQLRSGRVRRPMTKSPSTSGVGLAVSAGVGSSGGRWGPRPRPSACDVGGAL